MDHLAMITMSLFLMGIIAFVGVVANDQVVVGLDEFGSAQELELFFDSTGHAVCDYAFDPVSGGESGTPIQVMLHADWQNSSGHFPMFWTNVTETGVLRGVAWSDIENPDQKGMVNPDGVKGSEYWRELQEANSGGFGSNLYNILTQGLTAIVITVMITLAVIGLSIFGSTFSNEFTSKSLVTIGFFSALWALVSALGYGLLVSIPYFGWLIFLLLNFTYFLGVWGEING